MNNFEYIIASLPVVGTDYRYSDGAGFDALLDSIRPHLSPADNKTVDFLLQGFDAGALDADFYAEALRHKSRFIREYFRFDLNLRNAKVRYLNQALGRPADLDVVTGETEDDTLEKDIDGFRFRGGEFEEAAAVADILEGADLLARERGLDDITWKKIDTLTVFDDFNLDAVLGFLAKLHIVDRWLILDADKGRVLFERLVREIRGTYQGVEYNG